MISDIFCPLWIREWNQGEDGQKNKKLCKSRRGTFSSCGWAVWAKMAASGLRGEQSWTRAAIKAEVVTVGQNQWDEQEWVFFFVISAIVLAVVMQGAAAAWRHLLCILTKSYALYVLYVKSAVSLKWQVRIQNDKKITPTFTIIFSSKMQFDSALHPWNILF